MNNHAPYRPVRSSRRDNPGYRIHAAHKLRAFMRGEWTEFMCMEYVDSLPLYELGYLIKDMEIQWHFPDVEGPDGLSLGSNRVDYGDLI